MPEFLEVRNWRDPPSLAAVPAKAGVLRVDLHSGPPYLARTVDLRRRLRRLLAPSEGPSRRLTLREAARSVHYRRTGSRFESDLALYRCASRYRPADCRDYLKLRRPLFVKLLMGNRFPRACVTRRLTRSRALFYGPFPTPNSAQQFLEASLDLFLIRRCTENLDTSPDHPGCIWGEMGRCLRPCQQACDEAQYLSEARRLAEFLATNGSSLLREAELARDRASESMEFERAAHFHRIVARAKDSLRMRPPLAHELGALSGIVLQRSAAPSSLELIALYKGSLQDPVRMQWDGEPVTGVLGPAIRDCLAGREWAESTPQEKEDHLALLQRWHGSSFRKGEFVACEQPEAPPLRRTAAAAARVAAE